MGNREDLLAGARRVIIERGVAKVTARDIASAAGVSLAAIGYHFGSKEQLITEALMASLGDGIGDGHGGGRARDRRAAAPRRIRRALEPDARGVRGESRATARESREHGARAARPEASRRLAEAAGEGYLGIAEQLRAARPELSEAQVDAVAKLDFALVQSLGILWLLAPGSLPSGDELARAVAVIAGAESPATRRSSAARGDASGPHPGRGARPSRPPVTRRVTSSSASATERISAVTSPCVFVPARMSMTSPSSRATSAHATSATSMRGWKTPAATPSSRIPEVDADLAPVEGVVGVVQRLVAQARGPELVEDARLVPLEAARAAGLDRRDEAPAGVSACATAAVMVSMNRSLAAYTSSRTISLSPLK
jgi:AcrR family transcriptional regulator